MEVSNITTKSGKGKKLLDLHNEATTGVMELASRQNIGKVMNVQNGVKLMDQGQRFGGKKVVLDGKLRLAEYQKLIDPKT